MPRPAIVHHHRTLFLSDLHLGAVGCRADLIMRFLRANTADTYVLVGDILDIWQPLVRWRAPQRAVIRHLVARQRDGAQLIYVRGNHDPAPETADPDRRLPVRALDEHVHEAADGRRYLVIHGDGADSRALKAHWLTRAGSWIDSGLRGLDRRLARHIYRVGPNRRSLIEAAIFGLTRVIYLSRAHEARLVAKARMRGLDGVIAGHFHMAGLHDRHGRTYANCGDWVDSFTALAEDQSGRLRLMGGRGVMDRNADVALPGLVRA
jgi:UDP-2,3-diacylglucosamine pyrophosphatase LpxH